MEVNKKLYEVIEKAAAAHSGLSLQKHLLKKRQQKNLSYLMPLSNWLVLLVLASQRKMALHLSAIIAKVSPSLSQSIATQLLKEKHVEFC